MLSISLPMHTTPASDAWLHDTVIALYLQSRIRDGDP